MSLKARTLPTIRSIHALLISFLLPSHITTTELTGQGHLKTEIVVKKLNNFPSVENKKILNKTYDCDWTFLARHCKQVVPEDEVTGGRYMSRRYYSGDAWVNFPPEPRPHFFVFVHWSGMRAEQVCWTKKESGKASFFIKSRPKFRSQNTEWPVRFRVTVANQSAENSYPLI